MEIWDKNFKAVSPIGIRINWLKRLTAYRQTLMTWRLICYSSFQIWSAWTVSWSRMLGSRNINSLSSQGLRLMRNRLSSMMMPPVGLSSHRIGWKTATSYQPKTQFARAILIWAHLDRTLATSNKPKLSTPRHRRPTTASHKVNIWNPKTQYLNLLTQLQSTGSKTTPSYTWSILIIQNHRKDTPAIIGKISKIHSQSHLFSTNYKVRETCLMLIPNHHHRRVGRGRSLLTLKWNNIWLRKLGCRSGWI